MMHCVEFFKFLMFFFRFLTPSGSIPGFLFVLRYAISFCFLYVRLTSPFSLNEDTEIFESRLRNYGESRNCYIAIWQLWRVSVFKVGPNGIQVETTEKQKVLGYSFHIKEIFFPSDIEDVRNLCFPLSIFPSDNCTWQDLFDLDFIAARW